MKKIKAYRQGDCVLIPVQIDEKFDSEIKPDNGRTILAYGEVTGHAHALPITAKQYKKGNQEYVKITKPCQLRHEEHAPVDLPVGLYEKIIAREYDTVGGERRVTD